MNKHIPYLLIVIMFWTEACTKHQCPAYASVRKKEQRMRKKTRKRSKRGDEIIFTKNQLKVIKSRHKGGKPPKKQPS